MKASRYFVLISISIKIEPSKLMRNIFKDICYL
jgi:hypothetical protein